MQVPKLIKRIANPRKVQVIYAIAASNGGIALLNHLGFNKIDSSQKRIDNHNLYFVDFINLTKNILAIARENDREKIMHLIQDIVNNSL